MIIIKVAVMGAGLSGLTCAITLEKCGIQPVVFEKRSCVGDRFVNAEIMLSILSRPVNDAVAYLADQHQIYLKPPGNIKKLLMFSENEKASIIGALGFTSIRGRDEDSFENQLAKQFKGKINYNSTYSYEDLLGDFTHVIMATGDAQYVKKVQLFQEDLTVTLKGSIVEGRFDRYTVAVWLDNRFAPQGYGYLIPISEKEANIVIAYPDYQQNRNRNINLMWDMFYDKVCNDFGQSLKVTDNFEITGYIIGKCQQSRIGNTFFTGNCLCAVMPFMGFGQFSSIMTGIHAAQDICGNGSYSEMCRQYMNSYDNSLVLRRIMEKLNNSKLDSLVKRVDGYFGARVFNSKNIDILKYISYLLRPLAISGRKKV